MAKQPKDFKHPVGTYNGINLYFRLGEFLSRRAGGGLTREAILNDPKMEGIRNNNNELGICSRFVKGFKQVLAPLLEDFKDTTLHQRLMSVFMKIKKFDETSVAGQRHPEGGLLTLHGRQTLEAFRFTPNASIKDYLGWNAKFDKQTGTFHLPNFDPKEMAFSKGATHFRLELAVFVYDSNNNSLALHPLETIEGTPASEKASLDIPSGIAPDAGVFMFGLAGLRFYKVDHGVYYQLYSKKARALGFI